MKFICDFSSQDSLCEQGMYWILGYPVNFKSHFARQWVDARINRKAQLNPTQEVISTQRNVPETVAWKNATEKAKSYIRGVAMNCKNDYDNLSNAASISDTVPHGDKGMQDRYIIPYNSVQEFYRQKYCPDMIQIGEECCSHTTFVTAFKEIGNISTLRQKGSFNTCGICNNADDLIKDDKRFTRSMINVFEQFKTKHILQQRNERQTLEDNIFQAKQYDSFGNTKLMLLYSDGMTVLTGDTPMRRGNNNPVITNRVIGVLAVCGPINEMFIYNLDNFVSGGANTMIEIMRQGTSNYIILY